jgi:hypothetical protein
MRVELAVASAFGQRRLHDLERPLMARFTKVRRIAAPMALDDRGRHSVFRTGDGVLENTETPPADEPFRVTHEFFLTARGPPAVLWRLAERAYVLGRDNPLRNSSNAIAGHASRLACSAIARHPRNPQCGARLQPQ